MKDIEKKCPICNATFMCRPGLNCHCENLNLSKDLLKKLQSSKNMCLCKKCLAKQGKISEKKVQ